MLPFYIRPEKKPWFMTYRRLVISGSVLLFILLVGGIFWFRKPSNDELAFPVIENQPLSEWSDPAPVFEDEQDVPAIEGEKDELQPLPPPPPASIAKMKTKGCVADGFLSGYGGDINSSIALINRSECYYLHRALETWLKPPDFKLARKILKKVEGDPRVYGMFIAEAIDTKEDYRFPQEDRDFDFKKMCRPGSKNYWGEHSCKPTFESGEYRKYLRYITERAMDMGVQSFLFGQVFYQERADLSNPLIPEIIRDMREYAAFRGMNILIGAQTNDITNPNYLQLFDFVEGGVGLSSDGTVEDGPCFSRWYKKPGDWCWALLWNQQFKSKVKNVFVHFDWSGKIGDDMGVFTRMGDDERRSTMERLHRSFLNQNVGFLLPLLATLHRDNDGCYGPKQRYYSASRKYSCQDEDAINRILSKEK
ncbi:MAG: hypothetical protein ABI747_03600 [Candidatus Moraniibacteriota bacterium]